MKQKIKTGTPLNVLFLEDNPKDAEVCRELIIDSGYNLNMEITATEKGFESFLCTRKYDVILSDFKLPGFDAFGALRLCNKICPEVPFICVSGTIGEETAVELLKLGAVDYILKDKLERLPFAIERAIDDRKEKESRQKAEILLAASEMQYRRLFESAKDGILILNVETGKIVDVNPFLIELLGYSKEEFLEKEIWEIGLFKNIIANKDKFIELQQKKYVRYEDLPLETSDGRKINVEFVSNVYSVNSHKVIQCNIRDITERKKAEEALRESNERFQNVFEYSTIGKSITSPEGKLLKINAAFADMLGYSIEELQGLDFTKITYPDDIALSKESVRCLLAQEKGSYNFEKRYYHKNGNIVLTDVGVALLFDKSKKPLYFLTSIQNITERKQAEEMLLRSENEFHVLAESMPQIVWITRPDGWNIYLNQKWVDYTGLTLEESYGYNWNKPFHPDDQQRAWDAWEKATKTNSVYSIESRLLSANGTYKWFLVRGVPLMEENGLILKWFGTCTDIHELKITEIELRESELRFKQVSENAREWIWEVDKNGLYTYTSPVIKEILGYNPEEIVGKKHFYDLVDEYEKENFKQSVLGVFAQKINFKDLVNINRHKDGREIILSTSGVPILDDKGDLVGYRGVDVDITERKRSEETFKKLSSAIEQTADTVIITDREGIIEYVNQSFVKLTGYSSEEVLGKTPRILKSGTRDQKYYEGMWHTILSGKVFRAEVLNKKKNGDLYSEEKTISPILDKNKNITHFVGTGVDITKRKLAEEALRESETMLLRSQEIGHLGSWEWDIVTNKVIWSAETFRIYGYQPNEIEADFELVLKNMSDESIEEFNQSIEAALKGENPHEMDFTFFTKNKDKREVYTIGDIKRDEEGNPLKMYGVVLDITDRKRAEEKIRNLAKFPSENPFPILRVAKNGTLLYVNESGKQKLPEWNLQIEHSVPNMLKEAVLNSLNNGEIQQVEFNHSEKTYLFYVTPIFGTEYANLYGWDITDRKKLEANLSTAAEIAKLGYWEYDVASGDFTFNDQYYRLIHGSSTEKQGGNLMNAEVFAKKLVNPDDAIIVGISLQEAIESPDPDYFGVIETRVLRDNGDIANINAQFKILKDSSGKTYKVYGNAQDITDREIKEKELIEAKNKAEEMSRLKTSFLTNMSHELRTPLIGILGNAEFLEKELNDKDLIEMANNIKISGQRLNTTLNNILDIAKIEAEKIKINMKELDLIKYLSEQTKLFKASAEEKGLSLNFETREEKLNAFIDEEMFVSTISNLLNNAIKFTQKGKITLRAMKQENNAVIEVEDTGIGVPEHLQEIVFDPFRQASEGHNRSFEGAGLGLAIVKKYMGIMGGTITMNSKPGDAAAGIAGGSTFILKFPLNGHSVDNLIKTSWA